MVVFMQAASLWISFTVPGTAKTSRCNIYPQWQSIHFTFFLLLPPANLLKKTNPHLFCALPEIDSSPTLKEAG